MLFKNDRALPIRLELPYFFFSWFWFGWSDDHPQSVPLRRGDYLGCLNLGIVFVVFTNQAVQDLFEKTVCKSPQMMWFQRFRRYLFSMWLSLGHPFREIWWKLPYLLHDSAKLFCQWTAFPAAVLHTLETSFFWVQSFAVISDILQAG